MKLLFIYGNPREESYGGVEEHSKNLVKYLSQYDLNLEVITYGLENDYIRDEEKVTRIIKRSSGNILFNVLAIPFDLFRLMKEIKKLKPDVVHFQGTHPLYCLGALHTQRNFPTLITVHGIMSVEMDLHMEKSGFLRFFSKFIERRALSKIKNIIVVAPQVEELIKEMTNSKTYMIPNGVDVKHIKEIKPLKLKTSNNLIFVGNLVRIKGLDMLIEAFSIIKNQLSNSKLLIVGNGNDEEYLKNLVSDLNLKDNIEFLGFMSGDQKFSYIKSADILVLPSLWESLPIVVLEGMACGKPVVATNVGGIPFLIKDGVNGLLVKPGNIEELAQKLLILLKNKSLQKEMGKQSLEMIKDLSWSNIADRTYKVYLEIVQEEVK